MDHLVIFMWLFYSKCWAVSCLLQGVAVCTATCAQLHKRAEKITATLMERGGLNTGDNVVLLYPPGEYTHSNSTHCYRTPLCKNENRLFLMWHLQGFTMSLPLQALTWLLPSTAASTPGSSQWQWDRLILRIWLLLCRQSGWSSTWVHVTQIENIL